MSEFKLKAAELKNDTVDLLQKIEKEYYTNYKEKGINEEYIYFIVEKLEEFKKKIENEDGIQIDDKEWNNLESIIIKGFENKIKNKIENKELDVLDVLDENINRQVRKKDVKTSNLFKVLNSIIEKIKGNKSDTRIVPMGGRKSKLRRKKRANKKTMKRRR